MINPCIAEPARLAALKALIMGEKVPMIECDDVRTIDELIKYYRAERVFVNWVELPDGRGGIATPEGIIVTLKRTADE
jgi:hypothetical protein